MTARPTPDDESQVPHHCYACIEMMGSPEAETFNVQKYRELALAAISDVHGRGNIPIVCGGTNYYIEALLFKDQSPSAFDKVQFETEFDESTRQIEDPDL